MLGVGGVPKLGSNGLFAGDPHAKKIIVLGSEKHSQTLGLERLRCEADHLQRLDNGLTSPHLDFDTRSIGDDLLGQFYLSAWH